jgi:outer membrane protein assembly factor BamD
MPPARRDPGAAGLRATPAPILPRRALRPLAVAALALVLLGAPACAAKNKKQKPQLPPQQAYDTAMQKIAKKHYYAGRTMLQELMPRVPPDDREFLPKIQLAIADAYFKDGGQLNYGEALNSYRTFLTYYPNHDEAARVQYMVGMSLFQQALSPDRDQSLTQQAILEFAKIRTVYPGSPFVEQAGKRIIECNNRLAEHERFVAHFYQKRRQYNAAIDRYRRILDHYPEYNHTAEVLLDIGSCLLKVGNRPEAEEFFARLFQDQPGGKLSARAKMLLSDFDRAQQKEARKEPKG